jgi:periplasmic protein TonB
MVMEEPGSGGAYAGPFIAGLESFSSAGPTLVDHLIRTLPAVKTPPPTPTVPVAKAEPREPLRVGGQIQAAKILRKVIPVYPLLARQARVSGVVHLVGVIAKDGTIERLELVSGHPLLARAAMDAVRQWVYRPTLLNGEPVEVIAPIDVIFTLNR